MTFRKILNLKALEGLRIVNRYDIEALPEDVMQQVVDTIFSEPNVDNVYVEDLPVSDDEKVLLKPEVKTIIKNKDIDDMLQRFDFNVIKEGKKYKLVEIKDLKMLRR